MYHSVETQPRLATAGGAAIYIKPDPSTIATFYSYTGGHERWGRRACGRRALHAADVRVFARSLVRPSVRRKDARVAPKFPTARPRNARSSAIIARPNNREDSEDCTPPHVLCAVHRRRAPESACEIDIKSINRLDSNYCFKTQLTISLDDSGSLERKRKKKGLIKVDGDDMK